MNDTPSTQLRLIFDAAAEMPAAERFEFVHTACESDALLEREVLNLLGALSRRSDEFDSGAATWLSDPGMARNAEGSAGTALNSVQGAKETAAQLDIRGTGAIVNDFQLGVVIGRGATGTVYAAVQLSLGRPVAIKLLQSWAASREARRRFIDESAILARLHHPGIAQVIAAGSHRLLLSGPDQRLAEGLFTDLRSVPWIAMELVEGAKTILEYCRAMSLPALSILRLFAQVCDAVHYGHQQGVIHRDLKPANILVDVQGRIKVIDFGIAKAISDDRAPAAAATVAGGFMGSLRYMSPEQFDSRANAAGTRSDVYSLAVVLYESLTGQPPYSLGDGSFLSAAKAVCETVPTNAKKITPAIPRDAALILDKALRKDPTERYQSAAEFAADLRRVLHREPVRARAASVPYKLIMFAQRRPLVSALTIAAVLGLIAGIVGISVGLARERAARAIADAQRDQARHSALLANLTAADSHIRVGDGGSAMRRLLNIPEQLRGWEWRHLAASADTSTFDWQLSREPANIVVSPNGKFAACGSSNGRLELFDIASRKRLHSFDFTPAAFTSVWSLDENFLAAGSWGGIVIIDRRSGNITRKINMETGSRVVDVGWSPDGTLLAAGRAEPSGVVVYLTSSGDKVFTSPTGAWVYGVEFSADGQMMAWSDTDHVVLVDTATWTRIATVPVRRPGSFEPSRVKFSPDGSTLAVTSGLDVELIDTSSATVRTVLRGHAQRVHSVSFDAAGKRVVTTSIDRTVRVWDARTGALLEALIGHDSPTMDARFTVPDNAALEGVCSADTYGLRFWNPGKGGPVFSERLAEVKDYVSQFNFSDDGRFLEVSGSNGRMVIRLNDRMAVSRNDPRDVAFLCAIPDRPLSAALIHEKRLAVLADDSGQPIWTKDFDKAIRLLSASPDGKVIAVLPMAGPVILVSVDDGSELGRVNISGKRPEQVAFSPDGALLATMCQGGPVQIWNTRDLTPRYEIAANGNSGFALSFSPDGSLLTFSHARDGVTVWDVQSQRPIRRIESVGGAVWSAAINAQSTRIAVGAQDRITHIYELASGDELLQLRDHTGSVMSLAWSQNGRYLASGGYDKRVFVYDSKSRKYSPNTAVEQPPDNGLSNSQGRTQTLKQP